MGCYLNSCQSSYKFYQLLIFRTTAIVLGFYLNDCLFELLLASYIFQITLALVQNINATVTACGEVG